MFLKELFAQCADLLIGRQSRLVVVAQAARVLVDDPFQVRHGFTDLEQLVDLFLVLDDREPDLGIVEDEGHFGGNRVLVHRHRDAAQALDRDHREVQARAVLSDDRQVVAASESRLMQSGGQLVHLGQSPRPAPSLPDAEILLADRGGSRTLPSVQHQQSGKRVSGQRLRHDGLSPSFLFRASGGHVVG